MKPFNAVINVRSSEEVKGANTETQNILWTELQEINHVYAECSGLHKVVTVKVR